MSGVALDVPVVPVRRSFVRLLLSVAAGYVLAAATVLLLALPIAGAGYLRQPFARPGPFPADGAWGLSADVVAAIVIVLIAARWISWAVGNATLAPVSFGVVVAAVAVTGFAPFLTISSVAISGLIALLATTWIVRRFAIGRTLSVPRVSWLVWASLALVGVGVFGSYAAYHPLTEDGFFPLVDMRAAHTLSMSVTLKNAGWADVTILRVDGGSVDHKLPYTLKARSQTQLTVRSKGCATPAVELTYSVLGGASSQRFTTGSVVCRSSVSP
jgi:hypothetical protein